MLFHDIKSATAKALPTILAGLKSRGYRVVHMRAKAPLKPLDTYDADLAPLLAKAQPAATAEAGAVTGDEPASHLIPFFGEAAVLKTLSGDDVEVATLSPPPRERTVARPRDHVEGAAGANPDRKKLRGKTDARRTKVKRSTETQFQPFNPFGFLEGALDGLQSATAARRAR